MLTKNAWATTVDDPTTSLKRTVWIKKPDSYSSLEIRNNILRDEFAFTDADIKAFNQKYPRSWVIEDTKHPNKWATAEEIKSWATGLGGTVPIVLEEPWGFCGY